MAEQWIEHVKELIRSEVQRTLRTVMSRYLTYGVVTDVTAFPTSIQVQFAGASTPVAVRPPVTVPTVAQTVVLAQIGTRWVVTGVLA